MHLVNHRADTKVMVPGTGLWVELMQKVRVASKQDQERVAQGQEAKRIVSTKECVESVLERLCLRLGKAEATGDLEKRNSR